MEKLNKLEYKFRDELDNKLLAYNVITSNMYFLSGNTKKFIQNMIDNKRQDVNLEDKYIEYLKNKRIIIEE